MATGMESLVFPTPISPSVFLHAKDLVGLMLTHVSAGGLVETGEPVNPNTYPFFGG